MKSPSPASWQSAILLPFLLTTAFAQTCTNYGEVLASSCICPPGLTSSSSCSQPVCGGSLASPGTRIAPLNSVGLGNVSTCACTDGWLGPACTVCQTSSACATGFTSSSGTLPTSSSLNSSMVCNTAPTTYASSQLSCAVVSTTLQSLFPLSSTLTISRTLDPSLSPKDNVSSFGLGGTIHAQLWYDGVEQFYCKANSCNQTVATTSATSNSSTWTCQNLSCACQPNSTFCSGAVSIGDTLTSLGGQLTIACDPPTAATPGTCTFNQAILAALFPPSGLTLTGCSYGECVQQYVIDQALGITGASDGSSGALSGGVIAGLAVVGAILLGLIALLLFGFVAQRKAKMKPLDADRKSRGAGLEWKGIGYQLGKPGWQGRLGNFGAWMKGIESRSSSGDTEGKLLLNDVSGRLGVGGLCCILGPSGAGKSTLVDILAGKRKSSGHSTGSVAFFTADGDQAGARHRIGFVDQSDVLSPTSTVREVLTFAAHLRLGENVSATAKSERVFKVMSQLGLTDIADSRIGNGERRGISGGECRRVSIGVELIAAPEILILDEPTSGLDSVSAAKVIAVLKALTQDPHSPTTVIASIHQPSSQLYHQFDTVCLLANGRQLYFGPGGQAPGIFFAERNLPCPPGYNIADHLLEIASFTPPGAIQQPSSTTNGERASVSGSADYDHHSGEKATVSFTRDDVGLLPMTGGHSPDGEYPPIRIDNSSRTTSRCATTFLTQFQILSGREWRNLRRDKTLLVAHVTLACILGIFSGGLYFKVNLTIAGFQNRVGSLFFLGSLLAFSSLSALYNLVEVRPLFLRERAGSYYSPSAWLLSRIIFDIMPLRLIPTILVSTITYFMVGLSGEPARFFKFLLILVEFSLSMTVFNFLLACVIRNGGVAILVSSLYNLFLMTYAGFFVNINQIPPVLRWLRYFSTLGYMLEALSVNEVGSGLQIVDSLAGVKIQIGAQIIMETLFGFGANNYYRDVLVLFAFIAGYSGMLVGAVWMLLKESR